MSKKINIAFAANENYVPHLEISLYSLLRNNKEHRFNIYVLSSDIGVRSEKKLVDICNHFDNSTIKIIKLNSDRFINLKTVAHFSRDIYSRYLLPELLPSEKRIIYFDSDILVTGDIASLYDINIRDYYVAGVRDIGISKPDFNNYLNPLGLDNASYINSGVLVMNLEKIRNDDMVKKLIDTTTQYADMLLHPDQDVINIVFKDKIRKLSGIWNFQDEDRRRKTEELRSVKVIHYTTKWKPWNTPNIKRGYNRQSHELYDAYEYDYLEEFHRAKKISIITPVFNTSKVYIDDCIDSLLSQTYKNIEIILVDDGSQKETAGYLDDLAKKDKRIVVIHKKNGGSHRARQAGFERSTGELIAFVDSDDRIMANYIQKLYISIKDHRTMMSICESWDEIDFPLMAKDSQNSRVISGRNKVFYYGVVGFPGVRLQGGVVWGKLFSRKLINAVNWDNSDYQVTEDEFMMTQILSRVNRLSVVDDQLYYYRRLVATSKEFKHPKYNRYNGKPIPIVKTAADLYERSQELIEDRNIRINEGALVVRYVWMLERYFDSLASQGGLDKANEDELIRQSRTFIPIVLGSSYLTDEKKLRTIVILGASQAINTYDRFIAAQNSRLDSLQTEVNYLSSQNNRLNLEIGQFLGIKRSARLLLGNIKRRVKSRFFRPHS